MTRHNGIQAEPGFTLLEVMVAVSILGIALVVIMQAFSLGLRSSYVDKEYSQALLLARAKMGEIMIEHQIEEGFDSGTFDTEDVFDTEYNWSVDITTYERPQSEEAQLLETSLSESVLEKEMPYELFEITMKVTWDSSGQNSKNLTLSSLRLIEKEDEEFTTPVPEPRDDVDQLQSE